MNFCSNCVVLGLFWDEKNTFLAVLMDNEVKKYKSKNCFSRIFLKFGKKSLRKCEEI